MGCGGRCEVLWSRVSRLGSWEGEVGGESMSVREEDERYVMSGTGPDTEPTVEEGKRDEGRGGIISNGGSRVV